MVSFSMIKWHFYAVWGQIGVLSHSRSSGLVAVKKKYRVATEMAFSTFKLSPSAVLAHSGNMATSKDKWKCNVSIAVVTFSKYILKYLQFHMKSKLCGLLIHRLSRSRHTFPWLNVLSLWLNRRKRLNEINLIVKNVCLVNANEVMLETTDEVVG